MIKEVKSAYDAARYRKLRGKILARVRAHYSANPESIKKYTAGWAKDNPDKVRAYKAAWRERNRGKISDYGAKRYAEKKPMYGKHRGLRRARVRSARIGDADQIMRWEATWRSKKTIRCYWCRRVSKATACHADHIVAISRGGAHAIENLCVSCGPCNWAKNAKSLEAWNNVIEQPVLL